MELSVTIFVSTITNNILTTAATTAMSDYFLNHDKDLLKNLRENLFSGKLLKN